MSDEEERRETRRRRAWKTYFALDPVAQGDLDQRVRLLAERHCDERGSPRHDFWTTVAGGELLYDVVKAWSQVLGRDLAPPPSVSFARAKERIFVEVVYAQHREIMERVAPLRRGEFD